MVWPTLGSRMAKERTEQNYQYIQTEWTSHCIVWLSSLRTKQLTLDERTKQWFPYQQKAGQQLQRNQHERQSRRHSCYVSCFRDDETCRLDVRRSSHKHHRHSSYQVHVGDGGRTVGEPDQRDWTCQCSVNGVQSSSQCCWCLTWTSHHTHLHTV